MENAKNLKGYQGVFFDEETCNKLLALQKRSLEKPITDMHITFHYGIIQRYPDELIERDIPIRIIGYACDGNNSGFLVELPEEFKHFYRNYDSNHHEKPPHITASLRRRRESGRYSKS